MKLPLPAPVPLFIAHFRKMLGHFALENLPLRYNIQVIVVIRTVILGLC